MGTWFCEDGLISLRLHPMLPWRWSHVVVANGVLQPKCPTFRPCSWWYTMFQAWPRSTGYTGPGWAACRCVLLGEHLLRCSRGLPYSPPTPPMPGSPYLTLW